MYVVVRADHKASMLCWAGVAACCKEWQLCYAQLTICWNHWGSEGEGQIDHWSHVYHLCVPGGAGGIHKMVSPLQIQWYLHLTSYFMKTGSSPTPRVTLLKANWWSEIRWVLLTSFSFNISPTLQNNVIPKGGFVV